MAIEYLKDGHSVDKCSLIGNRLAKSADFIKELIESIISFLIECIRLQVIITIPAGDTLSRHI